jgi:hypothetical protein
MRLLRRVTRARLAAGCRLLGSVVALTAMLGQVGSYAHLALTAHVTCAEHGELVEADQPGIAAATGAPHREAHADVLPDSNGGAHGHDHCLLTPHRRDRATKTSLRTVVATAQLPFVTRHIEANGPPPAIRLILLAPKNSPPV